jgi:hypothetical protein
MTPPTWIPCFWASAMSGRGTRAVSEDTIVKRLPPIVVAFLAVGVLIMAFGVVKAWRTWRLLSEGQRVEGKVVALAKSPGSEGRTLYAPVIQYEVDGTIYRNQGRSDSSSPDYQVGDTVTILCPPSKPAEGVIETFSEMWLPPIAFGGGGLLVALVGLTIWWWRTRLTRRPSP